MRNALFTSPKTVAENRSKRCSLSIRIEPKRRARNRSFESTEFYDLDRETLDEVATRDGSILITRKLPGTKVPWEFQAQRPDTDHFNRDYKPELAQGGTEIGRINPGTAVFDSLTHHQPPRWDLRPSESPDGRLILFCRAETGQLPGVWVMDSDRNHPRLLTSGLMGQGADHPRWLPKG